MAHGPAGKVEHYSLNEGNWGDNGSSGYLVQTLVLARGSVARGEKPLTPSPLPSGEGAIEQDARDTIRRQDGAVRTPGGPQQGLPAQEVVVAEEHGWCGTGEELAHGCSRVSTIDQVTAYQEIDRRQGQGLIAPAQAHEMGNAIAPQLLGTEC